jgi:FkbM family methyltransferase
MDLRAALRGGITHVAVNQIVPNPAERVPAEAHPTSAEAQPASNGLGIPPPAVPLYRRVGRRYLQSIRPLALPFLARLQGRVSLGVDASFSAQVLRQVLSEIQAINAKRQASNARLGTMADTIQMLHRTVEDLNLNVDKTRELSAVAVEYSSKLLQSRAVPLGDEVLARSPFGWLLLPSEDLPLVGAMLESGGSLEPGTAAVVRALLEPNDLAIDVGANIGALSLAMAHSVAPHGRVLAIEPTPRTAKLLRRTCALSGLEQIIQIEECAVGATDGTAMLAIGATCGHNSLLPLDKATDSIEVRVRPLDALLPSETRPALVKIDAEGFELEVWRGMERLLRETPDLAVIVEFGPSHLLRSGVTIEAWFETLTGPGFTPWEIDEATGTIRPLRSSGLQDVFSMNLLLLRDLPSRWPRLRIAT